MRCGGSRPFSKWEGGVQPAPCFVFKAHLDLRGFSCPRLELKVTSGILPNSWTGLEGDSKGNQWPDGLLGW